MSDVSELSDVELSPSTDSLDTLMGFETEAGRTTVVSQSSSSVNQPASSENAIGSSDSESIHVSPRAAKGEGTQDGRPDRVYQRHLPASTVNLQKRAHLRLLPDPDTRHHQ